MTTIATTPMGTANWLSLLVFTALLDSDARPLAGIRPWICFAFLASTHRQARGLT
jgi:hypothetical protein